MSRKNPRGTSARAKAMTDATSKDAQATPRGALDIPGVLLAGGLARQDGRRRQADAHDRRPHHSRPRDRAAEAAMRRPHPQRQWRSARFAAFGLPVIPDGVADFPGPLAGILAALDWAAANRPDVKLVLSAAADCPFLPRDLVSRLHGALDAEKAELAVAASDGQSHPVIGLWSVALREQLRHALVVEDIRKIDRWTARYQARHRGVADYTARSVLQCQHHGRYRGSRAAGGAGWRLTQTLSAVVPA